VVSAPPHPLFGYTGGVPVVARVVVVLWVTLGCSATSAPVTYPSPAPPTITTAPARAAPAATENPATPPIEGCPKYSLPLGAAEWTTQPNSDLCCPFAPNHGPPFRRFTEREGCEAWTHERDCRPGYGCSDGCNSRTCTEDGQRWLTTALDCQYLIQLDFRLGKDTLEEILVTPMLRLLESKQRRLILTGDASPEEGNVTARFALARRRAESVRRSLVKAGAAPERLTVEVNPQLSRPAPTGSTAPVAVPSGTARVTITTDPSYRVPSDFPADACEQRHYCWCDDGGRTVFPP
jgi:hypothetical protein